MPSSVNGVAEGRVAVLGFAGIDVSTALEQERHHTRRVAVRPFVQRSCPVGVLDID